MNPNIRKLHVAEILYAAQKLSEQLTGRVTSKRQCGNVGVYGVPRGGINAAYHLSQVFRCEVVYDINDADIIIDDLVDSGATEAKYKKLHPELPFHALFDKRTMQSKDWLVFPWEAEDESVGPTDAVIRLLEFVGENPKRPGLAETPERVVKAWEHWTKGYKTNIPSLFKTFADGAEDCDEMVVVKDIPFYSHCEHHLAPFFGSVTIAYIPRGKIVGLSKLNRVVSAYAQRLQVQERLTNDIASALMTHLLPTGVAVRVQARHMCMESRGVCQSGHSTVTSALRGVFKSQPETRAEFLALCNG